VQQLLVDELSGERVILAPARALRPDTFRVPGEQQPPTDAACPFCDGNEHETPPEVARIGPGTPETPGWRVRVVPNKFPIVGDGVAGAHEVVILSPAHHADLGALAPEACSEVVLALRDRARFHLARGLAYAQPFVNHGKAAGASIRHPHAQLVVLDFVPPRVEARIKAFTREAFGRDQAHVVSTSGGVNVWCPRASTSPFFVRVALSDGGPRFDEASDDEADAIARALHETVARMHAVLGDPAYNCVFETAPADSGEPFQWWVDVIPRLTVAAGFEFGTGVCVNVVSPADAAAALRGASVT
jgi:UDPglucose--hexose-1-phosphate uridylyltransferase